jgi:hypothetical protein
MLIHHGGLEHSSVEEVGLRRQAKHFCAFASTVSSPNILGRNEKQVHSRLIN